MNKPLTLADVREVYEQMSKYTGFSGAVPKIIVVNDDSVINAYASERQIGIYSGMLKFLKNKDELAGVIGHELGHVLLGHVEGSDIWFEEDSILNKSSILEGNADKWGVYLMLRAGYDPCQAKNMWDRLREREGDNELTFSHPNYSYRYWQLDFPMCGE